MKLIEIDNYELKVADEALLIRPIRELFEEDKTKRKENFYRQMSYMFFMVDPRSTYQYITDEKSRAEEVKRQEGFDEKWEPSKKLKDAMAQYASHVITTQSLLLQDMRKGIDNVRRFLADVDLTKVDEKAGKPIYQVSTITGALKQVPELAKALAEAEKALQKDFEDEGAVRGNKEKSMFEDI